MNIDLRETITVSIHLRVIEFGAGENVYGFDKTIIVYDLDVSRSWYWVTDW